MVWKLNNLFAYIWPWKSKNWIWKKNFYLYLWVFYFIILNFSNSSEWMRWKKKKIPTMQKFTLQHPFGMNFYKCKILRKKLCVLQYFKSHSASTVCKFWLHVSLRIIFFDLSHRRKILFTNSAHLPPFLVGIVEQKKEKNGKRKKFLHSYVNSFKKLRFVCTRLRKEKKN